MGVWRGGREGKTKNPPKKIRESFVRAASFRGVAKGNVQGPAAFEACSSLGPAAFEAARARDRTGGIACTSPIPIGLSGVVGVVRTTL